MGNLSKLALCLAAASSALAAPAPSAQIVHPSMNSIMVTEENTINSTGVQHSTMQASNPLAVVIKNSFSGSSQLYTYVSGMDTSGNVILLSASGSWYYPPSASSGVPVELPDSANVAIPLGAVGTNTSVTLPSFCNSCRFWIAEGKLKFFTVSTGNGGTGLVQPAAVNRLDPSAGINWGFVEFNYVNDVYANLSFVDFAGLVMGMALKTVDGAWQIVKGLKAGAITTICNGLAAQHNSDGQPWDELCQYGSSGEALRVLSPNLYISANADKFSGYYDSYINSVWTYYQTHTLTVNTQAAPGSVACTVSASTNMMSCAGDNRAYSKPTAHDIFSCSDGPFNIQSGDNAVHIAVVPRLCAAFHRTTYLLSGGNVQPSLPDSDYYTVNPTSHYDALIHANELDGKGYAFSYDDVNPSGANAAGVVAGTASLLYINVGGWN